jgi:hypothetical protein
VPPAGLLTRQRRLYARIAVGAGAVLLALLSASCNPNGNSGTTAAPSIATPTTVASATTGQAVRVTGYSFRLPSGWHDETAPHHNPTILASGKPTQGGTPKITVASGHDGARTLADASAAGRRFAQRILGARLLGQTQQLSIAGAQP